MSEINACYIIDYLNNFDRIINKNKYIYNYFLNLLKDISHVKLFSKFYNDDKILIGLVPLIFENENDSLFYFEKLKSNNIFSKKYYRPLDSSPKSNLLYKKILCIPMHTDLELKDIDVIIQILKLRNH